MSEFRTPPRRIQKHLKSACCLLVILSFFLTAGCATSGKPQYNIEKYILSYPALSLGQLGRIPAAVKFKRFSIAAAYNSTNMIFRGDEYSLDAFNYSRWAVNPADMISDCLLNDMRKSGLFLAVFSRYESDEGRFMVSGGVEELYLQIDKGGKKAILNLTISLQDTREKEIGKRMLFQKKYSREEPLQESSPRGYCQAASIAMQAISKEIIADIYAAVKIRTP